MSLTIEQLKTKADEMFAVFEINKFKDILPYGKNTNLIFEFCDYVDTLNDWELLDNLNSSDPEDAVQFRQMINAGIDLWLGDLVKTIAF